MAELTILHVLPRWNHGGGAQSVLAEARFARARRTGMIHRVMALEPGGSLPLLQQALRMRLRVHPAPDAAQERELVNGADLVVIHYWNAPSLRGFLDRWRGRALKWILYSRVNGLHPPQRLPRTLARSACHTVLTSPHAAELGRADAVSVIPAIVNHGADTLGRRAEGRQGVLHVGTLNVFKLAPNFIELHAGLVSPDNPVMVVGAGGDEQRFQARAKALGVAREFAWPGFAADAGALYPNFRILSYPASPFTYASSDKVVQESQLYGLPVLLYRGSPVAHLVEEEVTGVLADGDDEYRALLGAIVEGEYPLPGEAETRAAAVELHNPERKCEQLQTIYRQVLEGAAREVDDGFPSVEDWLSYQCGEAARAGAQPRPSLAAMKHSPELLRAYQCWACEGGIAHYANAYSELEYGRTRR